jgi:hypothetical protein
MAITQHTLEKLSHFTLCPTTTITATGNQTGVDIRALDGDLQVILMGTAAGSGADLTFRLEESADDTTYVAVTGGTFTAIGNAAYKEVKTFNASDLRRYIRLSCTAETSNASSAVTCVGYGTRKYEV